MPGTFWQLGTMSIDKIITLILKSAQARCELESLEMYFVHLKDLLWSYGNYNICKWYFISRCSSSFKEFRNFWLQFSKTNKPITNNEYAPFRKKGLKILPGWNFFEAESFSRLKVSRGWKCLNCSQGWKFLPTESFSRLKVSRGWKCLNCSQGWKFLPTESFSQLKVSPGRKCLGAEIVETESVSGLKVSFNLMAESVWRLKMSGLQISRNGNCLRAESVLETYKCYSLNMKRQIIPLLQQERNHREDRGDHCLTYIFGYK